MKTYNVFDNGNKIAEFVEFTDGWGFIHWTYENAFPKNNYSRALSLKRTLTANGFKYEEAKN